MEKITLPPSLKTLTYIFNGVPLWDKEIREIWVLEFVGVGLDLLGLGLYTIPLLTKLDLP